MLQWQNAKIAYEKAIALDEDSALAFQGLSTVYRRLGDNQQTVDCALRAVSLLHRLPLAHFNLGVAMTRSGENTRAVIAFETALRFHTEMVNAHRYLATIYKNNGGDREKAKFHRSEIFRLTHRRGRRSAEKGDCHLSLNDVAEHAEGLLAAVVLPSASGEHVSQLLSFRDIFPGGCYLAASLHHPSQSHAEFVAARGGFTGFRKQRVR